MSQTLEKLKRVAPQIRPAGVGADYSEPGVKELTSSYNPSGRVTPDGIRKFHHRGPEVDAIGCHWGVSGDPRRDTSVRYGMANPTSDSVDVCMRPAVYADKMSTLIGEEREKKSKENVAKPLGRVPEPKFPIETPTKGFGITIARTDTSKSIMNCWKDTEPMHPAGEQYCRGYNWEEKGIDFSKHRFGVPSKKGARAEESFKDPVNTPVVRKTVTDYNSTVRSELGKPKAYGFDNPEEWESNVNGTRIKPVRGTASNYFQLETPSMKDLLTSWAVSNDGEEGLTDGAAESRRPIGRAGGAWEQRQAKNANRVYPDRPGVLARVNAEGEVTQTAAGRNVLTLKNMDDEATVEQLVHPCRYVTLGVESRYFAGGRDLEDVRSLAKKCNFGMSDAQIDEVFHANSRDGKCSIEEFKNAAVEKGYI